MIETLLTAVAPHLCCRCGRIGAVLCTNCKNYINSEHFEGCARCGRIPARNGICRTCRLPFEKAWLLGERREVLEALINLFKFERVRAASEPLVGLWDDLLPVLPENTVIVPVPTLRSHARQRGYDHTLLLARSLGHKRHLRVVAALSRATTTSQRGANAKDRLRQAKEAFMAPRLLPDVPYLLIDDVVTTGATLIAATRELKRAGARTVWVAALARQPLD